MGFLPGDEIDLTGVAATSESFVAGTLLALYGGGHRLALMLMPEPVGVTSKDFTLSSDHNGGVLISLLTPTASGIVLPSHV